MKLQQVEQNVALMQQQEMLQPRQERDMAQSQSRTV
jgi:hypothetical protein